MMKKSEQTVAKVDEMRALISGMRRSAKNFDVKTCN